MDPKLLQSLLLPFLAGAGFPEVINAIKKLQPPPAQKGQPPVAPQGGKPAAPSPAGASLPGGQQLSPQLLMQLVQLLQQKKAAADQMPMPQGAMA